MPGHTHTPRSRPRAQAAPSRAAGPLAWWVVLLALYLALASTLSVTQITIGAAAAAAGAAAAAAAGRALYTSGGSGEPDAGRPPRRPARLLPALARLPGQVVADTARITVRGAAGGDWAPLAVAPGRADRGTATLLISAAPGTYVGGVDPERGLLRVHRLDPGPSPYERSLRRAGLVADPAGREAP